MSTLPKLHIPDQLFRWFQNWVQSAPAVNDVRYLQIATLTGYSIAARELFLYERSYIALASCVVLSLILDALIGWTRYRSIKLPVVPLIIAMGASIQIDARSDLFYVLMVAMAHLSKAFVTFNGRHIFNPTNFAVIVLLTLFPNAVTGFGSLFSGFGVPTLIFFTLGTLTVWRGNQLAVSYSWLLVFAALAPLRAWVGQKPILYTIGTMTNPMILLFTFHMISDPATTPKSTRLKIAFGSTVAIIDSALRFYEFPHGHFFALFLITCFMPWVREYEERVAK